MAVFYAVLAVCLVLYIRNLDWRVLLAMRLEASWLAIALILAVLVRFLYPLIWREILVGMGARVTDVQELYRVYAASWMGRYIPGKAVMLGARVLYADGVGASRAQALVSFAVEQVIQLGIGSALGLGLIAVSGRIATAPGMLVARLTPVLVAASVLILILLLPPVLRRVLRLAFRLVGRAETDSFPGGISLLRAATGHIPIQLGFGAYTICLALSVFGMNLTPDASAFSWQIASYLWGTFTLAICLGMLAVFAPAGLGAREAVQLVLLSAILRPEHAAMLILLHRLVELAADVTYFLIVALALRAVPRRP